MAVIHTLMDPADWCEGCGCNPCECPTREDIEDPQCSHPRGHEFVYTGTQYGGDDERWHGEGRCYCIHCGADGDA